MCQSEPCIAQLKNAVINFLKTLKLKTFNLKLLMITAKIQNSIFFIIGFASCKTAERFPKLHVNHTFLSSILICLFFGTTAEYFDS